MAEVQFSYTETEPNAGEAGLLPLLPLTLEANGAVVTASGLLDSGASVNVLPLSLGKQLGFVWEAQNVPLRLTGNLANYAARAVLLQATVGGLPAVRLAFAWTENETVPLLLGQVNFFAEFDVCFFRSRGLFQLSPKL